MVFGPLPTDTYCLNIRYSIPVEGLSKLKLFDYTTDTDVISHTEFGVDTMETGLQVCPWPAEELCQQHETAGRCAADRNCGWCEVKGCLANKDVNAIACEALRRVEDHGEASDPRAALWTTAGDHPVRCNRGQSCSECIAIPGCGWCHSGSACIAGAASQRSKFLGFLEEARGEDSNCADPGDSDESDIAYVAGIGHVSDDECNAILPIGAWKKCVSGCVPRQNSCPAGSLVTWFKRGAPHFFDMLTGKRNVRCELCGFDSSTIDLTNRYPLSTGDTLGTLNAVSSQASHALFVISGLSILTDGLCCAHRRATRSILTRETLAASKVGALVTGPARTLRLRYATTRSRLDPARCCRLPRASATLATVGSGAS